MPAAAALALTAGLLARVQSFALQEPAVLRRRRGAVRDRRARHGTPRRPHSHHAPNGVLLPGRLRRDFGVAAVQRLRLRMADLSGHIAEPGVAVLGAEDPGARGRGRAGAVGRARRRLLLQGVRHNLSWTASHRAASARARPIAFALAAMAILATLCLLVGVFPGQAIDALSPATQVAVGAHMPTQSSIAWLSIAPVAESRSSYNGLLVFLFIVLSATSGRKLHPPLRLRRAAARACLGLRLSRSVARDAIFSGELRAADPAGVRRRSPSWWRSGSTCRRRATRGPPHLDLTLSDRIWNALYLPLIVRRRAVRGAAQPPAVPHHPAVSERRVRRAGRPAGRARVMAMIVDLVFQLLQMTLVILVAPLLTGVVRATKARLTRRRGPPLLQPYRRSRPACPQGGDRRRQRLVAVPLRALSRVRLDLGRRRAGADLRYGAPVLVVGRPHRHHRAARRRRGSFWRWPGSTSERASAGSARAASRCSARSPSRR